MNYYIREIIDGEPNAGSKARIDVANILQGAGWTPLTLNFVHSIRAEEKERSIAKKVQNNLRLRLEWEKQLKVVNNGDTVFIQFPVLKRPALLATAISAIKRRGGRLVLLIHDLELLRYMLRNDVSYAKKMRINYEEKSVMRLADKIIVHNANMKAKLVSMGFSENKMIELGIFDYLIPDYAIKNKFELTGKIAIAGTLRPHKTKYLMELPRNVKFNLYGIGYEDQGMENITYFGAFPPDELPVKMEADFGLVWDGDSANTCSGIYGEYLRINNPHKTSLYLASGLPVIIWKEAALADFIIKNNCGFTIESTNDIGQKISELSEEDYRIMKKNAMAVSEQLRNGLFTRTALLYINE